MTVSTMLVAITSVGLVETNKYLVIPGSSLTGTILMKHIKYDLKTILGHTMEFQMNTVKTIRFVSDFTKYTEQIKQTTVNSV